MKTFKRPNVLIIYTDQQRLDSLRCYGNELAITPNLDRLAEEGARLDHYFVQNPVCMPSRMSFLTGRYCGSLGIGNNGTPFPEDAVPIQQLLNPYGYHTAQIGKLHFQPHAKRDHKDTHPLYGFDTFILSDEPGCYDDAYTKWVETVCPEMLPKIRTSLPAAAHKFGKEEYSTVPRRVHKPYVFEGEEDYTHSAFVTSEMCNFIKKHKEDTFFAIAGFYAPHSPINPPKRFVDMYDLDKIPLPKLGENEKIMPLLENVPKDKWKEVIAYYLALVTHIDDCVGNILNTLKETGIEEDTIVIFTTDHGEYLGDHGRINKGMPGHDCIIRVPFIMRYPSKFKSGMVIDELVEGVDIMPTILDYCGIQIPSFMQGKSIKDLLDETADSHKEDILVEFFNQKRQRSSTIRTKEYKYYCHSSGEELLYDLVKDPDELTNIINEPGYTNVLSEMRKRMILRLYNAAYINTNEEAPY